MTSVQQVYFVLSSHHAMKLHIPQPFRMLLEICFLSRLKELPGKVEDKLIAISPLCSHPCQFQHLPVSLALDEVAQIEYMKCAPIPHLRQLVIYGRSYKGIIHTIRTDKDLVIRQHTLKDSMQRMSEHDAASQPLHGMIIHPSLPSGNVIVHQLPVISAMYMHDTFLSSPPYQLQEHQVAEISPSGLRWSEINHVALASHQCQQRLQKSLVIGNINPGEMIFLLQP